MHAPGVWFTIDLFVSNETRLPDAVYLVKAGHLSPEKDTIKEKEESDD